MNSIVHGNGRALSYHSDCLDFHWLRKLQTVYLPGLHKTLDINHFYNHFHKKAPLFWVRFTLYVEYCLHYLEPLSNIHIAGRYINTNIFELRIPFS